MLPKKLRIRKAEARDVFMRGSSVSSPAFMLRFEKIAGTSTSAGSPSKRAETSLFAVSVSKKVANTAVLRNRTRRRVYSVLRDMVAGVRPGFLVAISVKKGGEVLGHPQIVKEVHSLLSRAGLLV